MIINEEKLLELHQKYPKYNGKLAYNSKDLTGQMFGKLLVLYRTNNKCNVAKNRQPQWVCECQCDNKTICIKSGVDLRQGRVTSCGCAHGQKTKELLPGTIFGFWQILERAPNRSKDIVYYKCKCTLCNETIQEVSLHNLKTGQSTKCQKCRGKIVAEKNAKDETNNIYGYLKVIRRANQEELINCTKTGIYWVCDCLNCGASNVIIHGEYLRNGDTKSCGCLISVNENKISKMLQENNIKFKKQQTFIDLYTVSDIMQYPLTFDFGVYDNDGKLQYLIEYDGIQHFQYYEDNKTGWRKKENFKRTRYNDLKKNKYCFDNNIPLIRIPYTQEKIYTINDLKLETTRFLLTSQNEDTYYSLK